MADKEKITLGSGKLYVKEFVANITDVKATITDMVNADNLLGYISGGSTLEYKPDTYEAEDDLGIVSKTILTKEEVTFKSGIMTWNGNTLKKLCSTARVTQDTANNLRIVKIGGISNQDGKLYVILFVHEDTEDGNAYVLIAGKNQAGFSIAFAKDKETVIDAEFKAKPLDSEGTKVIYAESVSLVLKALTVTSVAGTTTGTTKVAVSPVKVTGNTYVYKTGATVTLPAYADFATGYTIWDGVADITAVTGNEIAIVEVNSSNKVIGAGKVVVVSK